MKKIIGLLVLCAVLPASAFTRGGGTNPVPWPWGAEIPIIIPMLDGVWMATVGTMKSVYVIRPLGQQLEIVQLNPQTCAIIGSGKGVISGRELNVTIADNFGHRYVLDIHVFNQRNVRPDIKAMQPAQVGGNYYVATMTANGQQPVIVALQKVTDRISFRCSDLR